MKKMSFGLLGLAFLLSACSLVSDLGDMKDNIVQMNQKLGQMDDTTGSTYYDLRAANAATARNQFLKVEDTTPGLEAKAAMAAQYMYAFEFQSWTGQYSDDLAKRDDLFNQAVQEFLQEINMYLDPKDIAAMNVSPASMDNTKENAYALIGVLHLISSDQMTRSKNASWKPVSLLDLLNMGLQSKAALASGSIKLSDMPLYQQTVLANEAEVVYLLQLRFNVLSALVLSRVSQIETEGLLTKIEMRFLPWDPDLDATNEAELALTLSYIQWALDTENILIASGDHPILTKNISGIYGNMTMKPGLTIGNPTSSFDLTHNQLVNALKDFQKQLEQVPSQ